MPPKVIRKVRTPEGALRYGQPIGTIITKDMQAAAAFRFMYTPFTVQYYLGVLSYNQLVKHGKKYSPPLPGKPVGTKEHPAIPIPADFTLVTPAITEKAGLAGLWGFAQGPDGKVYRWDRMPDSSIVLRGVPLSSLKPEQKAQFPKPLVQADPKIDPRTKMQVHAWLDTTKMPDVPEAVSKTTQEMMDNTTIPQAEGDEAPSPTPKVKPEPSARWEKVEGTTLKAVQKYLAKEGKQAASPVYRLYLDKQSVGLVVKVTFNDGSSGWRLYQNGANISSASTKAGLLKIAVDNWMMGLLLPDGKANLPDSTQEAEEFGVDTGALPSPDSGLPEGTSGTEALTAEELLAGFDADDPDEQVSIPSDEMKVVLGTIKKVHQSKPSTPAGATVLAQQMDLITPEQASDALDWMKAHPEDFANIAPYDVAIPDLSSHGIEEVPTPKQYVTADADTKSHPLPTHEMIKDLYELGDLPKPFTGYDDAGRLLWHSDSSSIDVLSDPFAIWAVAPDGNILGFIVNGSDQIINFSPNTANNTYTAQEWMDEAWGTGYTPTFVSTPHLIAALIEKTNPAIYNSSEKSEDLAALQEKLGKPVVKPDPKATFLKDTPDIPPAEASEGSKPPLTDADLQQYGMDPFAGFNPDADLATLDPVVKLSVMLGVRQWVDTKGMTNPTTGGDLNLFMAMMGESIAKVQAALIPDEPENWKDLAKRAALTYLTVKPLSSVDIGSTQGLGWYGQLPPEVRSAISDIHIALGVGSSWEDLASVAPHLAATKEAQAAKILWWDRGYDFGDDVVAAVDYNEGVLVPDPAFGKPPVSGQFGKLPKGVMVLNGAQPISDFYSQLDSKLIGDESVEFDDLVADTGMQVMYAAMVQYAQDPQFWKQLAVDQWHPTNEHDRRVLGLVMAVHYVSQALFEDVGFSGAPGPVIAFMEEHYIEDVPDYDQPEKALQHVANDTSGSNFMQNFEKSWLEGSVYTGSSSDEELESERRFLRMIGLDPDNPGKRLDAPEEIAKSLVAPKQPKSWDDVPATERKFNFTDEQREKIAYDLGVDNPTLVLSTGKVTDNGYIEVWALGNQVSYRNFVNADGQFKWDDWEPDNNGYYLLQGVPAWKDDAAGFETWKNHAYLAFMEAGGEPELPYDVGGVNSLTDPTTVTVNGQTLHFEAAQFYPETVDLTIYPGQQIWEAGDVPAYLYDPVADAYFEVSGEPLEVKDLAQGKQVRVAKIPQDMALTAHNLPTGQLSVPKGSGGPEPVYALPGGLYASKKDIQEAIKTLKASKGIMVKQPLEKAGSPLAAMDYHAIAEPHKSKYEGDADKTKHALLDALEEIVTKDPTESGYSGKEMSKQWAKEAAKVPGVTGVSKPPTEPRLQVHFNADTHGAWSFQKSEATFSLPTNAILVYASGGEYASAYTDEVIPAWRRGLIGFWTVKDGKPDKFHGLEVGAGTGKSPLGDTHEQLAPDSPNSYGANSYKYVGVPTLVLTQGKWTSDYGLSSLDEAIGYSEQQGEQAGMSEPASSGPEMVSVELNDGVGKSFSVEVPVTAVLVYNKSSESGKPFGWVDTTEAVPGNAMMLHYFDGDGITTMDFGEWFTSYVAPGMSFNTASGDKDGVPNSKGYVGFGAVLASLGNFDLLPYATKMILTNAVEYKANHPDADISQSLAMGYETAKMTDAVSGVPDLAFGYEIAKKWMDVNGLHTTTSAKQVEQIEVEWGWAAPEGSTVPKNSVLVILKDYLKGGSPGVMGWVDPADPDTLWYPTMDAGVTGSLPLKQYLGDTSDIKDKVRFVKAEVYADNPANGGALTLESALKVEVGKAISKDLPPNVTLTDAGEFQVTFDGHTMEIPADALIVMNGKKIVGYERIDADGHIYAYRSYSSGSVGWLAEKPSQLDGIITSFPSKSDWGWATHTTFPATSLIGQSQPLDHNFDPTGLEVTPLKGSVMITYPSFKKTVGDSQVKAGSAWPEGWVVTASQKGVSLHDDGSLTVLPEYSDTVEAKHPYYFAAGSILAVSPHSSKVLGTVHPWEPDSGYAEGEVYVSTPNGKVGVGTQIGTADVFYVTLETFVESVIGGSPLQVDDGYLGSEDDAYEKAMLESKHSKYGTLQDPDGQPESSPDLVETIEATKKIQFIESDAQNALNMVKDGWTGSWTDWHPTNYNADFDELSIGAQAVLFGMVRDLMDNAAAVVSMSPSDARQTLVEWAQAHDDDLHAVYGYSSALPAVFGWLVNHNLTQVPSWGDPKGQAALMASDAEGTEWGSLLAKYVLGKPIPNTGGNVEGYTTKILKILGLNPDVPGAAPSWGKKKAGSKAKKPKKVGPVPPHVTGDVASLNPFHPPAAGRWGKKGSKGYVDVYSDGSGVYVSPAGKKTTLDAAKVRDRIAKGLTLQVPAEPLPYRGVPGATYRLLTIDGKQVLVEGNGPNGVKGIKYTAFKILPDGSVEARNDQDTTVPSEILTPQEFADLAFSDTYQNAGMLVANLGKANNIPLFKDEEQAKKWADANGGYPLAGGYYSNPVQLIPNDSGYIEALEGSLYDFSFWISKWNQEHNYSQKITGMGLPIPVATGQYDSPGASVRRLYYTLRRAYGIDPDKDMYTPVREGSYDEVGPFYVNKDTKGVWAPRGIVSQTVYSTLDVDQSAKELTDWMTGLVTDMGLSGILFPKKSMYVKSQKQEWILAFRTGDFAKIKQMEKQNGNENPALDGLPDKVYWEARIPTEIPAGMPIGQWSSVPVFNSMPDDKATPEIDNYLLAAKCAHPEYLSYSERKAWVINHLQGNARLIRVLSQRAEQRIRKGDDPHTPEPVYTPGVTPQSLWEPHVKSILQADLSSVTWSLQESIYEEFYKDEMAGKTLSQVMKAYPHHAEFWRSLLSQAANVPLAQVGNFDLLFPEKKSSFYFKSMFDNAKKAENLAKAEASKIPVLHIPASKLDLPLEKGTHPCFVVEDQNGDPWFFKQMPEKFRVDVEVMANELAHAVGYDLIPEVMPVTGDKGQPPHQMGGKIGFAQRYQPNLGTIKGKKVSSLTLTQQTDIALDHVLDWFIDNDDGHKDNFLITEDGHLVPIDKGRAMKHWGVWDGLAGNTSANHNASLASTELFEAIKKHEISEKDAQAIYKAVMQQAAKIQGTPWAPLEDIIRQGQARRTQWYPSHTPQNVDDLVEKVKFRHDHMTDDMEAVWSKVLAQAGYEKPPTPKPPVHDMYESVDTQFAVNLDETRTLGQSLMVASPTWEEGHLLFWTDTQKQERVSHGQGYLIGPKKKKLYTDLHDAAGGSKSPQTPEDSHAQEVDSQLHDLITAQHNTWRKMAQNHSKTVMGESETPVTVEEAETQYAQSVEQWKAMRASWEAEYGEDINPAYLDALEAQAYYWYESMRKELTDAIQEKRKSVRPRFNKPNLPVTNQPGSDWEQQWRITKDHHESTTVYKTGEETAYEMPVPQKMVLFAAKPESKEKAETIFEKRFPELAKMGVTLTVEKMQGPDGELHHRTLDMESDYMTSSGYGSGYEYVLTLPTGEKVRVAGPSSLITAGAEQSTSAFGPLLKGTSNLMSMGGLVRWDGNPGQDVQEMWEHVRPVVDALEPVVDVTDQDLQLMYWRMMCGTYQTHAMIPADRLALNEAVAAKAKALGAPANLFGKVESESHGKPNRGGMLTTFPTDILAQAGMSPEDELAFWQELFTPVVGEQMMKQFLDNEGWRPRFEHDIKSGLPFMHPYWQRADIDYMSLKDHWLIHDGMDLRHMVWTPLICTDERVRAVHQYWNSGQSSGPDQASGAGGVVYTRDRHGATPTGNGLIMSPIVYGRIGVYSAPYDAWGHPEKRMHNSPLMPEDMFWYSGNHGTPAHEVCVKWQIGMDSVYAIGETYGSAEFQTWMKKYGITEMGGKPVDEIVGKGHAGKHRKAEFERIKKSLESGGWI